MPPRRIQRVVRAPLDICTVCLTSAVLVRKRRTRLDLPIQFRERVYITPPPIPRTVIPEYSTLELVCNVRMSIKDIKCLVRMLAKSERVQNE
jgi:hypothetical protein